MVYGICTECGSETKAMVNGELKQRSRKGMCLRCYRRHKQKEFRDKNREKYGNIYGQDGGAGRAGAARYSRNWRWRLKLEMVAAYGGKCVCCGETEPAFLTIDHIYGDGGQERKLYGGATMHGGSALYKKLKNEGWPKDRYRILCFNCNLAIGFYGCCPHQAGKK